MRSYADAEWLLFVRGDEELLLTAVAKQKLAEKKVDEIALKQHVDELGVEVAVEDFRALLLKTLEDRESVAVETEEQDGELRVVLELTYKFSAKISRKGVFQLPIVADVAPSVVELLKSVHEKPPLPVLSAEERLRKEKKPLPAKEGNGAAKLAVAKRTQDGSTASSSQSAETATPTVNPAVLKRRRVPTGTARRRGPKGARLAKN